MTPPPSHRPLLQVRALTRHFGGLNAVQDVNLEVADTGVHGLIGPNGAGKSTLINLLSGDLKPHQGRIVFQGRDITSFGVARTARLGIARSYQKSNIFGALTCLENCWLGALRHEAARAGILPRPHTPERARVRALEALGGVELSSRAETRGDALSHGERRQLEIAMLLTGAPKLLLLDEPLAGLGPGESENIVALIKALSAHRGIVLVEHDLDALFSLADTVSVLESGKILASAAPAAVRADSAVRRAYLGRDTAAQ
ncbi:ABC transporter ATP-binding protein [Varunaivibrio sulfuroxidans]|uniref:Amino acid/amide ABC transporter ATP-binding protein 1 (HAAT family) n=1 Tax=Varunaivibrio sulfuroxidans TaxID=1773489 RepID=A0A4R3JDD7_9PROT|nr:ABC transporter ATP-binding protein [Varunaivibrio sulfuroxidans]TCS64049.1 amino acid/amide ABC transporter ATP-binding protein 1 (HAAT family) [Varunaivibrio sulfuroxidans]WES31500.1 ABC transporter ATP-binding protein [Varunaivibrio sulfuroxidans]